MTRLQRILIGILVAQLALAVFVFWPRPSKVSAGKLLLSDIKVDEITSLTIRDDKGASIKLARPAANQTWVLPDAGDFPADAAKITPMLTKLAAITTDRLVAQTAGSHKQLQVAVDAFQRRIDIGTAGGATRTLFLGSPAGGQASHVRVDGQNDVYVAGDVTPWQLGVDPTSWIDPAYVNVTSADVVGFALANANGQLNFSKDATGVWQMEGLAAGEQLDPSQVTSAAGGAAHDAPPRDNGERRLRSGSTRGPGDVEGEERRCDQGAVGGSGGERPDGRRLHRQVIRLAVLREGGRVRRQGFGGEETRGVLDGVAHANAVDTLSERRETGFHVGPGSS
jgi:hypothetical protein